MATAICTACGAETRQYGVVEFKPGEITHLSIEHEDRCPFLFAIETSQHDKYIQRYGYPIKIIDEDGN